MSLGGNKKGPKGLDIVIAVGKPRKRANGGATDGHWMEKAFAKNKGALHREMGVPQGQKIPAGKLAKAAKAPGKLGRRARAAENARG